MASEHSFDVVAEIDLAEVQNAYNTTVKQIGQRYDFKEKTTELEFSKGDKTVVATASDGYTLDQMLGTLIIQDTTKAAQLTGYDAS